MSKFYKKEFYLTALLLLFSVIGFAQVKVTGVVKGADDGKSIPGVSVGVKGTTQGVVTGASGEYALSVSANSVLVFSSIGYKTQEVSVNGKKEVDVILVPDSKSLTEVVVVGYGTQKKVNLTGAIATVSAAQLADRPVTGVANALEGTMAGVTIQTTNGQPGGDAGTISVRGIGSLNGGKSPLVIIDGITSTTGDMGAINADDIETISVLKDAASSAIYGVRAANGVILITTKKGKKGSSQITYSDYFGKQVATRLPDYLPSWQAATLFNQASVNEGKTAPFTDAAIQKYKDGSDPYNYPNTDWLGLLYTGNGFQQNHYLGVNGGNDKTQYAFSMGYFDQDGIIKRVNDQRYTTRLNLTTKINDKLTANADLSYTYNPVTQPQPPIGNINQIFSEFYRASPLLGYQNSLGEPLKDIDGSPVAWLNSNSFNKQKYYTLNGIAGLDWEVIKGLHINPSLAYKLNTFFGNTFSPSYQYYNLDGTQSGQPTVNSANYYGNSTTEVNPQLLINYFLKKGDHNIHALAGYSQEYVGYFSLSATGTNFTNNYLSELNLLPQSSTYATSDTYESALRSVFGRLNYDYKGKYLLEGDVRYDGSSRFATGHKWGLFPGGSAGWRVSEEDFFAPLKSTVTNLKLRGSWGRLGNQSVGGSNPYYPTIATLDGTQSYVFGGVPVNGEAATVLPNPILGWEITTTTDIGLDADLLNNKLSFTADYFVKNTTGVIYPVAVAAPYGDESHEPSVNGASVRNTGWEFALTYHDKAGQFAYNISANTSFIKNDVVSLGGGSPEIGGGYIRAPGYADESFYGYQAIGIFQSQAQVNSSPSQSSISSHTGPGDLIYKDVNGDGKIDSKDRVVLGNSFPKVTFGLNMNVSWKQLDLTAFFQGAAGVKNGIQAAILGQISTSNGKPTAPLLDSWTPSNPNATYPRALIDYNENNPSTNPSSFWIRNASYVRLKSLQLGYALPQRWADYIHVKKLRLYYSGQNILTFTQFYKWVDPEVSGLTSGYSYPQVKTNTIGLNVSF